MEPVTITSGPDRVPVYAGDGRAVDVVGPSLGTARRLGHHPEQQWTALRAEVGIARVEAALDGEAECDAAPLTAARAAGMLSGTAATQVALAAVRSLNVPRGASIALQLVKWGYEAMVFRCAVEGAGAVYALNVATDLTDAARAVEAAAAALAADYERHSASMVRPCGLVRVSLGFGALLCPVCITEWAELDELHVYADAGPQVFRWQGGRESREHPLTAAASRAVWLTAIRNLARYSWPAAAGWSVDVMGLGAGDLVGDGEQVVRVWSRKRVSLFRWYVLAAALLAHATDGGEWVFFNEPAATLDAVLPLMTDETVRDVAGLLRTAAGRMLLARTVLGAPVPTALTVLEHACRLL
jgi:hypothetical protein